MLLVVYYVPRNLVADFTHSAVNAAPLRNISCAALLPGSALIKRFRKLTHCASPSHCDSGAYSHCHGLMNNSLACNISQSKLIAKFGLAYTMLSRKNESDGNRKNVSSKSQNLTCNPFFYLKIPLTSPTFSCLQTQK